MNRPIALAGAALLACSACRSDAGDRRSAITLIDSVRVQETDSAYVGTPNAIAGASDGSVFVSDFKERKVIRIARDGSGLRLIASRGGGPGEVSGPTSLQLVGDSVLAVQNAGRKRIELFGLASLEYRGTIRVDWPSSSLASASDALVMGAMMPDSGTSFAFLSDSSRPPRRGGSVPEIYRRLPPIAEAFGSMEIARDAGTVIGMFEASNTMYRWPVAAGAIDSVVLTPSIRRGARPDLLEELMRDPTKAAKLAFQWSFPMRLGALSDDRAAVLFFDPTMSGQAFSGPAYLQVVDWRSRASCPEIALPVPADVPPRYAFVGDTLVALVQHPAGDDGVSSWIVRWRVGSNRC